MLEKAASASSKSSAFKPSNLPYSKPLPGLSGLFFCFFQGGKAASNQDSLQ